MPKLDVPIKKLCLIWLNIQCPSTSLLYCDGTIGLMMEMKNLIAMQVFWDASVSENENALTNEGLGWGSFALGALVGSVLPFSPEYKQKQVDELLPEIIH